MTNYDSTGKMQATATTHSFEQALLAALVVLAATVSTVFVLSATGVALAFLAGTLSAAGVHKFRARQSTTEGSVLKETLAFS